MSFKRLCSRNRANLCQIMSFQKQLGIKELAIAYLGARSHKRWKANTLQFSAKAEENLRQLWEDIVLRRYSIRPSLCFVANHPVKREIFAGDFRDRVVHHLVFNSLAPLYDRFFINDCYSCRKHFGTSYGIARMQRFMRQATKGYTATAYILKLDISGYFMNIDRNILYQKNQILISHLFKVQPERANLLCYLLRRIIFNDPTSDCRIRGSAKDWQGLPRNKSLFGAPSGKGLPIGNLTSQLFGNLYLNDFDHFVKEKLRCRYYGRYVDDIVIVHQDRNFLKRVTPMINGYLQKNLGLGLHPKKIYLQDCCHGFPFLGVFIKPYRIYVGKRIKAGIYRHVQQAAKGEITDPAFFNSYLGMMKRYDSYRLRQKIMASTETRNVLGKLGLIVDDSFSKVIQKCGQSLIPLV